MKHMVSKFKNININKKMYCMIGLFLIIPLVIIFWFMNAIMGKEFAENEYQKELEVLKQSRPVLENLLNDVEMISRDILSSEDTQMILEVYNKTGEFDENAGVSLNSYIRELLESRAYLSSISVYNEDRILLQCGNFYERESAGEIPGLRERIEEGGGKPIWESARILPYYTAGEGNEYVVSLQRNVNSLYRMENLGAERISIKEDYLCSLYSIEESSDSGRSYIYDENGSIVSASNKNMMGTSAEQSVIEHTKDTEGYFENPAGGKIVLYYRIPLNNWVVVKEMSIHEVNARIFLINVIIWICMALAVSFGFVFSFFQKRNVVNPVIKLSNAVSRFGESDFEIDLYTSNRDEIGNLNRDIIKMTKTISELIDTVYKSKIQTREAEILSLQSQINPHFLYNTLDTLRWIAIEHGEKEIAGQIEALSGLFRHVLNNGKEMTTVKEELEHLQNYLTIQDSRFGDKISTEISVREDLYPCRVVKLILQPLVENAFVHGLEKKVGGGEIKVTVDEKDNMIRYVVEDNGLGTDEKAVNDVLNSADEDERTQNIFALKNINNRIKLKYGEKYGLHFESEINRGTKVTVLIPRIEEESNESTDSR